MLALSNTSEVVGRHMTQAELDGRPLLCACASCHALNASCFQPWMASSCIKWTNLKKRPSASLQLHLAPMARCPRTTS